MGGGREGKGSICRKKKGGTPFEHIGRDGGDKGRKRGCYSGKRGENTFLSGGWEGKGGGGTNQASHGEKGEGKKKDLSPLPCPANTKKKGVFPSLESTEGGGRIYHFPGRERAIAGFMCRDGGEGVPRIDTGGGEKGDVVGAGRGMGTGGKKKGSQFFFWGEEGKLALWGKTK